MQCDHVHAVWRQEDAFIYAPVQNSTAMVIAVPYVPFQTLSQPSTADEGPGADRSRVLSHTALLERVAAL